MLTPRSVQSRTNRVSLVFFVIASIVIAIAASGLALSLAGGRGGRPPVLSAIALGAAISGMHYTAMAGLTVHSAGHPQISAPVLSSDLLAIVVAIVAFLVSGIFLLNSDTGTLHGQRHRASAAVVRPGPSGSHSVAGGDLDITPDRRTGAELQWSARRCGRLATPLRSATPRPARRVTHYVAVETVVAVHANAHYTYIFDGTAKLFCPLPISDVEARLDTSRFLRVHRSHIVNIERVRRLKRAGDSGMVELEAADAYVVPVSRSRVGWLKSQIGRGRAKSYPNRPEFRQHR